MTKILAITSDWHVNSSVGLCPPQLVKDDGPIITPSKSQQWLWGRWRQFWQDAAAMSAHYKAPVTALINGDWGDLNKHSKAQLFEYENYSVIVKWMVEAAAPMREVAEAVYVVRGTEAHTGGAGWLEEEAAGKIGATKDAATGLSSFWTFARQFEDVRVFATHHPGTNSTVPWTIGAAANRAAVKTEIAFGASPPHLAFFGHVHHGEDSSDNHKVRAIFTPPWWLANAFTYRIGQGWGTQEIGGILVLIDGARLRVFKRYTPLPTGGQTWTKI